MSFKFLVQNQVFRVRYNKAYYLVFVRNIFIFNHLICQKINQFASRVCYILEQRIRLTFNEFQYNASIQFRILNKLGLSSGWGGTTQNNITLLPNSKSCPFICV